MRTTQLSGRGKSVKDLKAIDRFGHAVSPWSGRAPWLNRTSLWGALGVILLVLTAPAARAQLVDVRRIWDQAPHNAFTDLVRYKGAWFCVFREGQSHTSTDGVLRVIFSLSGHDWRSVALLSSTNGDLRDPKLSMTPWGDLMLSGAVALARPGPVRHRSLAWFSRDGRAWSEPTEVGDTNMWLWSVTWFHRTAYSVGYETAGESFVRLYHSVDGRRFEALVPRLYEEGSPNESALIFEPDATAWCLLRRDGTPNTAVLGRSSPPYAKWEWRDLGVRIGGPRVYRLPDGRLVAVVRRYDGTVRTSLGWLEPAAGKLTEFLALPSGGDTSYGGLAWKAGLLWISYYSSHEGKTAIYLARVRLPPR